MFWFDLEVLDANIKKAYMAAVNPEGAFEGTNILICNETGFRIFSPSDLRVAVERKLASASVTQGLLGMNIKDLDFDLNESSNSRNLQKLFEWATR